MLVGLRHLLYETPRTVCTAVVYHYYLISDAHLSRNGGYPLHKFPERFPFVIKCNYYRQFHLLYRVKSLKGFTFFV